MQNFSTVKIGHCRQDLSQQFWLHSGRLSAGKVADILGIFEQLHRDVGLQMFIEAQTGD